MPGAREYWDFVLIDGFCSYNIIYIFLIRIACVMEIFNMRSVLLPNSGSPYKAMQVWKYRPVLLCNRLIFHHVLPEAIICN
jgi:hypothetical protein